MTHESRTCPRRIEQNRSYRESQRDPIRRREDGGDRRGRKAPWDTNVPPLRNREPSTVPIETVETVASSSKRKPVRRNLMAELGETVVDAEKHRVSKLDTKEWVRKSFTMEVGRVDPKSAGLPAPIGHTAKTGGPGIHNSTWYCNTEEEATVAKMIYAQNEAWQKVEGTFRQSKKVDKELENDQEAVQVNRIGAFEGGHDSGSSRSGKKKHRVEEVSSRDQYRSKGTNDRPVAEHRPAEEEMLQKQEELLSPTNPQFLPPTDKTNTMEGMNFIGPNPVGSQIAQAHIGFPARTDRTLGGEAHEMEGKKKGEGASDLGMVWSKAQTGSSLGLKPS